MSPNIVNPSPKSRFQEQKGNIEAHHTLLQAESLTRGIDMAILEYQRKLSILLDKEPTQTRQIVAIGNGFKLQGVDEFLSEFRNLAEKTLDVKAPGLARTLDHNIN